jgi:hypothetical protein
MSSRTKAVIGEVIAQIREEPVILFADFIEEHTRNPFNLRVIIDMLDCQLIIVRDGYVARGPKW